MVNDASPEDWRELFSRLPVGHPMRKSAYYAYLESAAWAHKKKLREKIDGGFCLDCGLISYRVRFQTHHLTYKTLGDENPETDLVTLCPGCHHKRHS